MEFAGHGDAQQMLNLQEQHPAPYRIVPAASRNAGSVAVDPLVTVLVHGAP